MDKEMLKQMLMDPSVTIDDILAKELADDFAEKTGLKAQFREEDRAAFYGTDSRPTVGQNSENR